MTRRGDSALQMTGAVKLPSGRSLKAYVSDRSLGVGPDDKNGKLLMEAYSRHKLQFGIRAAVGKAAAPFPINTATRCHRTDYKPAVLRPPVGIGALMVDEIKISGGFAFKNNSEFVGFACSPAGHCAGRRCLIH
jgi:hypothetical protein